MKKQILLLASLLCLCSCANDGQGGTISQSKQTMVETKTLRQYEFSLDMTNYWRFIDLSITKSGETQYYSNIVEFKGVLGFAYYDNVLAILRYDIKGKANYSGTITVQLNAAGAFNGTYSYDYVPLGVPHEVDSYDLYNSTRTITMTSITGKVLFSV